MSPDISLAENKEETVWLTQRCSGSKTKWYTS